MTLTFRYEYVRKLIPFLLFLFSSSLSSGTLQTPRQNFQGGILRNIFTASSAVLLAQATAKAATFSPPRLGVNSAGSFELCGGSSCVSSQDDRPNYFLAPWEYDGSFENMKGKLVRFVLSLPNNKLVSDEGRYTRFVFVDDNAGTTDDLEFYFPENDSIIQYRSCRRGDDLTDFGANRNRIELIKKTLRLDNIAVLRNRRRAFLFGESPFDTFGPPTSMFENGVDHLSGDMGEPVRTLPAPLSSILGDSIKFPLWSWAKYNANSIASTEVVARLHLPV